MGTLHGIKVSKNAPAISHFLYTNNLLVMCIANQREAQVLKHYFDNYCGISSQEVNLEKSSIFFSKHTDAKERIMIKIFLGFKDMAKDSIYLGKNLILSRNKSKDFKGHK